MFWLSPFPQQEMARGGKEPCWPIQASWGGQEQSIGRDMKKYLFPLVEIGQNVTTILWLHATINYLQLHLDMFATTSCVGHIYDYMQLVFNYFYVHNYMWTTFSLVFIQKE